MEINAMKLMIVDDEQDVRILFEQIFRKECRRGEIELQFAHSASEALELLEAEEASNVALVLSDINMPGLNGLDLLRILKEKFAAIDVYMISAYGDKENYEKAMAYGAAGYLTKPLDFDSLKERILKWR
jgi:YesN/AraC family two-component response regulator